MIGKVTRATSGSGGNPKGAYVTGIFVNSGQSISNGETLHIQGNRNTFSVQVSHVDPTDPVNGAASATAYWNDAKFAYNNDDVLEQQIIISNNTTLGGGAPKYETQVHLGDGAYLNVGDRIHIKSPTTFFYVFVGRIRLVDKYVEKINGPADVVLLWDDDKKATAGDFVLIDKRYIPAEAGGGG